MDRLKGLWSAFQKSRPWKAWERYSANRGNLLAGGVAFNAFFSIFPAVALAFTIFGVLLQGHPDWLDAIRQTVNNQLPGFVKDPTTGKGIIPVSVPQSGTLAGIAGVGAVVMIWAGLGWLTALRNAIREIFGVTGSPGNFALAKVRDLGVLVVLGLGILVSAALTAGANTIAQTVVGWLHLSGQGWIVSGGSLVGFLLDASLVALMLRVLSGVPLRRHGLLTAAALGGAGLTGLKIFGARLLAGTLNNPLFASFAVVVGLLVWLNLMSRVILLSAAWAANAVELDEVREQLELERLREVEATASAGARGSVDAAGATRALASAPDDVGGEEGATSRDGAHGAVADRQGAERVSVLYGAVLGAAGMLGLGMAWRGLRDVVGRD